jgi:hypothetical protein
MTHIPDRISTLELSKLCIQKALQELETQRNREQQPKQDQSPDSLREEH